MNSRFALLLVLLLAAVVRIPFLSQYPPPINQDEASRGYDAWCLLETGADQHGARWPYFLKSFGPGDYTAALSTYLTIPFVAMLGPGPWSIRLPDAILGVLSVWLVFAILRPGLGQAAALVGAAMLATDPWHVGLTRTGHESGFATFFILLGLYLLCGSGVLPWIEIESNRADEAIDRRRAGWAFGGAVSLCAAAWVYPATRLIIPCICVFIVIVFRKRLGEFRARKMLLVAIILGVAAGGAPLYVTALTHPTMLAARASVALIGNTPDRLELIREFFINYASNLSPRNLFWHSEDMSGAALPGIGQHLWISLPFLAAGLWRVLATFRRSAWSKLLLIWLVLYPVPAAICRDWNPHPMRCVAGIPLFAIICGIGAGWLLKGIGDSPRKLTTLLTASAGLWLINSAYAANRYIESVARAQYEYQTPLYEAMRFVAKHEPAPQFVLVTSRTNQPYIYALLAGHVTPEEYRSSNVVRVPGSLGFDQVVQMGHFFFIPGRPMDRTSATGTFSKCWDSVPKGQDGLVIQTGSDSPEGELLATFQPPEDSNPAHRFEVRAWRKQP